MTYNKEAYMKFWNKVKNDPEKMEEYKNKKAEYFKRRKETPAYQVEKAKSRARYYNNMTPEIKEAKLNALRVSKPQEYEVIKSYV